MPVHAGFPHARAMLIQMTAATISVMGKIGSRSTSQPDLRPIQHIRITFRPGIQAIPEPGVFVLRAIAIIVAEK